MIRLFSNIVFPVLIILLFASSLTFAGSNYTFSNSNFDFFTESSQETGSISVTSSPEAGMMIFLNDRNTGKSTPATIEDISTGVHTIKLVSTWYRTQEKKVMVIAGQVVSVDFTMVASFGELTVKTTDDALIYVDGSLKGSTTWKGRIAEGVRTVKVEKAGFVTREQQVTIIRGREISTDLFLRAQTGTLDIVTDPPQAMISLDGRMYGLSPRVISDLPFGSYTLTLEKADYTSVVMRVSINDTRPVKIEIPLLSGREVTLNSDPPGAEVTINQKVEGVTPLVIWLKYGTYVVKFEREGMAVVETINVSHTGKKDFSVELKDSRDPFDGQMVFVKGGSFRMGDTYGDGLQLEKPAHPVTVSDFYIGKYEVTQAQWKFIMDNNPSHFAGCDNCPVERVSWEDVQEFIKRLNELTGKNYRLPTEAEWEYAAKGGDQSRGYRYAGRNNINFVSWYSGNSGNKTNPVGQKEPNELGLYDMSGNVWEWVNDWFSNYTDMPQTNPKGPEKGDFKVVRGGSWFGYIGGSRPSSRGNDDITNRRSYIGFRLAKSVESD